MKETKSKQKTKEKKSNSIKNSSQNKSIQQLAESKLIKNKESKKKLANIENEGKYNKSKLSDKLKIINDKEIDELNKSIKEDNYKRYQSFNFNKKNIRNSVSQDLITKILEINNKESSLKNDSSNFFLCQKEEEFSNNINSLRSNKIHIKNNPDIIENKEESKMSSKKNENSKIQKTFSRRKSKNNKNDILKNKNNINSLHVTGTQDLKNTNIKLDSLNSLTDHQSENEHRYNSSNADKNKSHLKKADMLFGLNQISGSSSNRQLTFRVFPQNNSVKFPFSQRSHLKNNNNNNNNNNEIMSKAQKEIAQSILEVDIAKLKKEIYEYENTDVTDAINKLPIHKFYSDKNNNHRRDAIKFLKIKNNKEKKDKEYTKNIKEKFRILRQIECIYDSLDDEECEDEEDNNFYFEPNGNFILILDYIILITSLFYLILLPVHLSCSPFNEKNLLKDFVFIFIDVIFIIDLVSGFFKAYINFDEELIKNSILIVKNYLKTWFLLDFICGIPLYSIFKVIIYKFENTNCEGSCYFNYNGRNLYRLFELAKLLKLIKVFKINIAEKKIKQKLKKISFFYYWWHFIKQIFIFISIINLSSCLFIFSARNNYPNWILNMNMNVNNFISIYICSFYYIITTMTTVGYGDIQICSMTERIFDMLFLIIGTCLYSWMLTSASNYIQKMSEKNLKFDQKLEILDEIKANYPLMSHDLYRKVYILLHYNKRHEEVDKNIIIDSLPYSIRNDLLTQMYNPTIKNFKFFRYFRNSEFIIEIVSVLKPLVGIKGDLLINEGDYVDDIIFNKSGILSLEVCIDLNNPREFIEQYLIKYDLENIKNKKYFDSNTEFSSAYGKNNFNLSYFSKNTFNFNKINSSTIISNNNMNFLMSINHKKSSLGKEKIIKHKFQHLKIINIREKEHFGDVLMFLNEPSPLNLRINSKNAEILLLSKTDVIKISSNFTNIWKRMNENSIFNLEQIKILIMRKLSIFCYSNNIKIKSLYCKKDTKTGQNKINYSLIPIPELSQEENLIQNSNLNETNNKNYMNIENNFPQDFENFTERNTYVIKEEQSSEESKANSILAKEGKYIYKNSTISKKTTSKKMNDTINISNQKTFVSDINIHYKKFNEISDKNITENQNQFLNQYRSYSNLCQKKDSVISSKNAKNSTETPVFKINSNINNTISNENYSLKNSRKKYLSNSPILNNVYNTSVISSPKKIAKYQNFAEKSKINKKLISIPSFNFMRNLNNTSINCGSENVNDEIYPNENFEIKIPDKDKNLIINTYIESQENTISNCLDLPKKTLISDKKDLTINTNIEDEKHTNITNNIKLNNKFNNLKISFISAFKIKSSYDNINEFTKYRFISDDSLIKKTKIFLSKECGHLDNVISKLTNVSNHSPIHNKAKKSKSSIKLPKCLQNKKSYDNNRVKNLSAINDSNINSPPSFSKKFKMSGFNKTKVENEILLKNSFKEIKGFNKSFVRGKSNSTIKEEDELFKKDNSITKSNVVSYFSPRRKKRKSDKSVDNLVNIKTKNKLDLITENMKRDNQKLNNPNEFYADLFNIFINKK